MFSLYFVFFFIPIFQGRVPLLLCHSAGWWAGGSEPLGSSPSFMAFLSLQLPTQSPPPPQTPKQIASFNSRPIVIWGWTEIDSATKGRERTVFSILFLFLSLHDNTEGDLGALLSYLQGYLASHLPWHNWAEASSPGLPVILTSPVDARLSSFPNYLCGWTLG